MTASLRLFRSWESYAAERMTPDISLDVGRLRWKAFGNIATAVRVAARARDPPSDSDEAYINSGDPSSLHPIAESSFSDPPISSITVRIDDLDARERDWLHEHIPHAGNGYDVWEDVDQDNEEDKERDLGDGRKLVGCCNEDCPSAPAPLVIRPGSADKGYVTVHDYVVAVHEVLQAHRAAILQYRITSLYEQHGPGDVELWVNLFSVDKIGLYGDKPRGGGPLSFWSSWTSYVDRRLSGQLATREEHSRMLQPPQAVIQGVREALPRSHPPTNLLPPREQMAQFDVEAFLRRQDEFRNQKNRR